MKNLAVKYEIGDKVRIKTWKKMEEEYGLFYVNESNINVIKPKNIKSEFLDCFVNSIEEDVQQKCSDRILEITNKEDYYYENKNLLWHFQDYMIECLVKKYKKPIPVQSRFEILDL